MSLIWADQNFGNKLENKEEAMNELTKTSRRNGKLGLGLGWAGQNILTAQLSLIVLIVITA